MRVELALGECFRATGFALISVQRLQEKAMNELILSPSEKESQSIIRAQIHQLGPRGAGTGQAQTRRRRRRTFTAWPVLLLFAPISFLASCS